MNNTKDSFFSMDRLVEFGMGMAMSQQIVQNMNTMMANMRQPPLVQGVYQPMGMQGGINPAVQGQPVYQQYTAAGQQPQKTWQAAPQQLSQSPAAAMQSSGVTGAHVPPPVPQTVQPEPVPPMLPEVFYISRGGGKAEGPYSGTEIARLVAEKQVTAHTAVWKTGMEAWKTAADFPDLLTIIALVPPELTTTNMEENK